jgi:hypothetical protein
MVVCGRFSAGVAHVFRSLLRLLLLCNQVPKGHNGGL